MAASTSVAIDGRSASLARRRALSQGKAALPPASERTRSVENGAGASSVAAATPHAVAPPPAPVSSPAPVSYTPSGDSCRDIARRRRAEISRNGRGSAPASLPCRAPRAGTLEFAPKVVVSETVARQTVTGSRIGRGRNVTGDERGAIVPVSGTQYLGTESGGGARPSGPKVGHARTPGGAIVSGTLVRSTVPITGDEAGASIVVTGEADQQPNDDVTERAPYAAYAGAQFARQMNPHGASAATNNVGRSAQSVGSRSRNRNAAIETTEGGLAVTGSAVGRGGRVTGDEAGACRRLTGDQYLAPASAQAECGGTGGGTAPAAQVGAVRRDPVTGAKVAVGRTWRGRPVTGIDTDHDPRVTGDEPGACATITGSPYQGADTTYRWCDDPAVDAAEARLAARASAPLVTGDTPLHDDAVTGTARGAARDITGTPYYRNGDEPAARRTIVAIDQRFSVRSPQRAAHVRAAQSTNGESGSARMTGSFAGRNGKVTGNLEFAFRSRGASNGDARAARTIVSGEGRTDGRAITGVAWTEHANVTGTEGHFAQERNPSYRNGKRRNFAGSAHFKELAQRGESKHLVTGMAGFSSDTGARVTLSGGAQG